MPHDVPAAPRSVYGVEFREKGGWSAWLGWRTRMRKGVWRSYDDAVLCVHALKLKDTAEWKAYYRGERADLPPRPHDIPSNPYEGYGNKFKEKGGMGAWLGTGQRPRTKGKIFWPYDDAIRFVHVLMLRNATEWRQYVRGQRPDLPARPHDIPFSPQAAYGDEFREKGSWKGVARNSGIVAGVESAPTIWPGAD
jgi:hypothetical protein